MGNNTHGMAAGIEVTNINFGSQYRVKILDKLEQRRKRPAQKFDLTNIMPKGWSFRTLSGKRATNWTYFGLGGIVLWVKYHLYIVDSFNPAGATSLSVSLRKERRMIINLLHHQPSQAHIMYITI